MTGGARFVLGWTASVTALVVAIAVVGSLGPGAAARYAELVFPPLTRLVVPLGAAVPGSATLAGALVMIGVLAWIGWRRPPVRTLGLVVVIVLVTILWGLAAWGVHYRRAPIAERIGLAASASDGERDELQHMLVTTIAANAPSQPLGDDAAHAAIHSIAAAMAGLASDLEGWVPLLPDHVVSLPPGSLLRFGTSGIVSPWWLEAHVDGALPPAARIAVAAHELAHVAGWAREDEAEALGAWAALQADDANARYATALFQVARLASGLSEPEREALLSALPERARADLRAAADAASAYGHPVFRSMSRYVYDRYLRSQGIADGIRSYAASTDLLARVMGSGATRPGAAPSPLEPSRSPP